MRLWPSSPLELARPFGNSEVAELRSMRVDSRVEPQIKKMRALNSRALLDCASMTRTPLTRRSFESKIKLWTTLYGRIVRRPVFCAAGSVGLMRLKYEILMRTRGETPPEWQGAPSPLGGAGAAPPADWCERYIK